MNNIIFFDIDGTLLDTSRNEQQMSAILFNRLSLLRAAGNVIVACTARPLRFINERLPNLFNCLILMNGSYVVADNTILTDVPLSKEVILKVNRFFEPYKASYIFIGNNHGWAHHISQRYQDLLDRIYMSGEGYTQFEFPEVAPDVYLIDMFFETANDYERVYPAICSEKEFSLNYSLGDFTGDLSFINRTKASAVPQVLNYYGTDIFHTFAFGDSVNDIDLFKTIKNTCAVGNATPQLKSIASYVSDKRAGLGVLQGLDFWKSQL